MTMKLQRVWYPRWNPSACVSMFEPGPAWPVAGFAKAPSKAVAILEIEEASAGMEISRDDWRGAWAFLSSAGCGSAVFAKQEHAEAKFEEFEQALRFRAWDEDWVRMASTGMRKPWAGLWGGFDGWALMWASAVPELGLCFDPGETREGVVAISFGPGHAEADARSAMAALLELDAGARLKGAGRGGEKKTPCLASLMGEAAFVLLGQALGESFLDGAGESDWERALGARQTRAELASACAGAESSTKPRARSL